MNLEDVIRREEGDMERKKTQREIISEKITRKHHILTPQGEEYELDLNKPESVKRVLEKTDNNDLKTYILCNEIKNVSQKEPRKKKH